MNRYDFSAAKVRQITYDTLHPKINKSDLLKIEVKNDSIWELDDDNEEMLSGRYEVKGNYDEERVALERLDGEPTMRRDNPKLIGMFAIFDRENIPNIFDRHIADKPTMPAMRLYQDGLGFVDDEGNPMDGWKSSHWFSHPIRRFFAWRRDRIKS